MNVIIDTGCANLSSVKFAVERLGFPVTVSRDPQVILAADKLFLPGVGTATEAMQNLADRELIDLVKQVKKPLLGICLGMQMLAEFSIEGGAKQADEPVPCLGLVPGTVSLMQPQQGQRLPHMGWNQIKVEKDSPLFVGIDDDTFFYFVHSFCAPISEHTLVSCEYGQAFSAAIAKDNFYGVQFHPERSGQAGAKLLTNFINM